MTTYRDRKLTGKEASATGGLFVLVVLASAVVAFVLHEPYSDLLSEWLAARGAWEGVNPYLTTTRLAEMYAIGYRNDLVMPRTPGALLLFQPIGLLPVEWLPWVGSLVVSLSLVMAARYVHPLAPLFVPVLLVSTPGWDIAYHGHISIALLVWCAAAMAHGSDRGAGIASGVAVTLKLFPGLWVVVLLLQGRVRAALWAVGTFVALNVAGLTLPGVTLDRLVGGLTDATRWVGISVNGSLASFGVPVWAIVALVGAFLVFWPRSSMRRAVVPVSMLAGPLAWLGYMPAVLAVLAPRWAGWMLALWVVVWAVNPPGITIGMQALAWAVLGLISIHSDHRTPPMAPAGEAESAG